MKYNFLLFIFLLSNFGMTKEIKITEKLPYKTRVKSYMTEELLKSLLIGGGGIFSF